MYCATIGFLVYGFSRIKIVQNSLFAPQTKFTILVPFRDESNNLLFLLDSFSKLNYPTQLFEVILIDDDSNETKEKKVIKKIRIKKSNNNEI
jgi:glycosyltransferase involved in cell wall biosynthesis